MFIIWISLYFALAENILSESEPRQDHAEFQMNPSTQHDIDISKLVTCGNSPEVLEIQSVRPSCVFGGMNSTQESTDSEVREPDKIEFFFARICNGRKSCRFTTSDNAEGVFMTAKYMCESEPLAISFVIEYLCLRRELRIELCRQPIVQRSSYIYSTAYPKSLPKVAQICRCILRGKQGGNPHIEAAELILRGKQTGDESLNFTFTHKNGTSVFNEFFYHEHNDSDWQYNTRRDLAQDALSDTLFTDWELIEFTFTRKNYKISSGKFLFKIGENTAVHCSRLYTTATTLAMSEEYDVTSSGRASLMQSSDNKFTTPLITPDSSLSLTSTTNHETTSVKYRMEKRTVSKQGQNIGLIFGVAVVAVAALAVISFLVAVVVFKRRNKRDMCGGSPYMTSEQENSQASVSSAALTELVDKDLISAKGHVNSTQTRSAQSSGIETRTATSSFIEEHCPDPPGEGGQCDDSPISQHKNSLYVGAVSIHHNESPVVDHRISSNVGAVENGMSLSEQPYISNEPIRHNESPVIDYRNSAYVAAEADFKMVATEHKQQVPSDSTLSADSEASTADIDGNKGQTAQPIEDDHLSVYSLINDAELKDVDHRVLPDPGPVATDDGSYEQAIEVTVPQYAAADNPSISASDSSGSGNTDPDSSKIGPRDRRTFPDYAYAYAKTRGGGLSLREDPRPTNNQDPYSYIQIGDVAKPVKSKPEVIPEAQGEYPYAYADLRGRIIPGITEHVRVPGYNLEGDFSNLTDENVADSQLNLSRGQYTLEKPVPGNNL